MSSGYEVGFLIRKRQYFCIVTERNNRWLHRPPDTSASTLVIEILLLSKTLPLALALVLDLAN